MKTAVALVLAACFASAQAAEIPDELIEQCASIGGCVVLVPEGKIIPLQTLQAQIQEALQDAYKAGRQEAAKTCKRTDV